MTDEQILELAKSCGFVDMIGERDDETDGVYYECWEEQLFKFALIMYNKGICEGAYQQSKRYMEGVFDDD